MKREFLKGLDLTEEQIEQIMTEHGKTVEKSKADLTAKEAEISGLQKQLSEANEAIKGFEGLDVDGIKQAAADWEAKAKEAEKQAKEQLAAVQFDYKLENALRDGKARNVKAVKALLDMDKILPGDDGKIIGLEEQLKALQAENGYLFDIQDAQTKQAGVTYTPQGGGKPPEKAPTNLSEAIKMALPTSLGGEGK